MKKIILTIISVSLVGGFGYYFFLKKDTEIKIPVGSGVAPEEVVAISKYKYTKEYKHTNGNFSFMYPVDFTATSIPSGDGEAVVVQNSKTKVGVQVLITPFDGEDIDITPEIIKESLSDMKIENPQSVEIGQSRKGLAFLSDNQSFGGASREVWFVFRGNLYQISTYSDLDPFLQGLFGTWKFL
jgi:hypothetical protein